MAYRGPHSLLTPDSTPLQGYKHTLIPPVCMSPESARMVLLIATLEARDLKGSLLSHEARRAADQALALSPQQRVRRRAAKLTDQLSVSQPELTAASARWGRFGWRPTLTLVVVATLVGAQAQWLTGRVGAEFHILDPWLLFLVLSNSVLVVLGLFGLLTGMGRGLPWIGRSLLNGLSRLELRGANEAARDILTAFRTRWLELAGPMLAAEVRRALHLSSIAMVAGAMISAVLSGVTTAYKATVESTFLSSDQVTQVVTTVLGPPLSLFGGQLPVIPPRSSGTIGDAYPWLAAWGAALLMYVVLPRMVLVVLESIQRSRAAKALARDAMPRSSGPTIDLALMSHTNIGKTSLTRTLLRVDAGEVRDAEHVTTVREGFWMIRTPTVGLRLWDAPGFGRIDHVRKRLKRSAIGAWWQRMRGENLEDRVADEIVRTLEEEADVVAYLVDGSEPPESASHVGSELDVLDHVGVPYLIVLNHVGASTWQEHERLEGIWSRHLASQGRNPPVISLDAHQRCWVQEASLLTAVAKLITAERPLAAQLLPAWWTSQEERLQTTSTALADSLVSIVSLVEHSRAQRDRKDAVERLLEATLRLTDDATRTLLDIYGVSGTTGQLILELLDVEAKAVVPEQDTTTRSLYTVVGSMLSGLVTGLAADVISGGLTLGSGAIVGAVLGAFGGAGASEGLHWVKHRNSHELRWSAEVVRAVFEQQVSLYLAVAHYGRARGIFSREEAASRAESWHGVVHDAVEATWPALEDCLADAHHEEAAERVAETLEIALAQLWPRAAQSLLEARATLAPQEP